MRKAKLQRALNFSKQKGATMWTTLSVVLMVGFIGFLVFKLLFVYIDHSIIRASMQEIVNQGEFKQLTTKQILSLMEKRMQVDGIRDFKKDSFKVSRDRSGEKYIVINYSKKVPIAANVSALVEFNEEIRTGGEN